MPANKALYLIIFIFVLIFGALYYHSGTQREAYRETAIPYLLRVMGDVSHWQGDRLWPYLAPQAKAVVPRDQLDIVLSQYQRLGRFVEFEEPQFSRLAAALSLFSSEQRIGYTFNASFEHGDAVVTTVLLDENGGFSVYNINFSEVRTAAPSF